MSNNASIEAIFKVRSALEPLFSADGQTVYYLCDEYGSNQVWSVGAVETASPPRQVTFHDSGLSKVIPSPASNGLIYVKDRDGDERHQFYLLEEGAQDARALTALPDVMHNWGGWAQDASTIAFTANVRDPAFMDVYTLDVATGQRRCVAQVDGWYTVEATSPDMSQLLLLETIGPAEQYLHCLNTLTGELRPLISGKQRARFQCCHWHSRQRSFFGLTNVGRDYLGIACFDSADGTIEWLHTPDHDVENIALSPDDRKLAFVTNVDGFSKLSVCDLDDRSILEAPISKGVVTGINWSPDGSMLVFAFEGPTRNSDIWLWHLAQNGLSQLTHCDRAGLRPDTWPKPELVHYPTFDGRSIPAFFYRPTTPPPMGGYPAIIVIHGGPESQFRPAFAPELQVFLSNGYSVLAPNVRGSTGYGAAYAALDDVELRMDSVRDIKHARLWLADRDNIDSSRIAVFGGSYGGFMVLAAITEYPDLWKSAVEFYGIADFQTFLERTGPWRRRHRAEEYGDPVRDAKLLRSISPIHKVDRIRVPLFVAQGLTDPRVPPHESELIVGALRERSLPVEYLTIDDEGHGFVKYRNKVTVYNEVLKFLSEYL